MDEQTLFDLVAVKHRCPQCGGKTLQTEKDTSSGREIREFECQACGWTHFFEIGPALWKILSDASHSSPESSSESPR
jgi:predicted RNA-binding Zn-ribbon protein involved in translation (DUF1610 family)